MQAVSHFIPEVRLAQSAFYYVGPFTARNPAVVPRAEKHVLVNALWKNDGLLENDADAGAKFNAPVRVDDGKPAGRVGVAMLPDGDALVTWVERIGGDTAAVRVRRVKRDGSRGAAMTVASSSAARASGFPKLAVTGSNLVFAWTVPGKPSMVRVAQAPVSAIR